MIRTVGVIGGMGPMATVDFMRRIIEATPAHRDQDHLHLIVDCDPSVPDRTAASLGKGQDPSPQLARMAHRLEVAGADILVMPCNSAYVFADAIRSAVDVPLVDWPGVVVEHAIAIGGSKVGLLATSGTLTSGMYHRALDAVGADAIEPSTEDQRTITAVIESVKAHPRPNDASAADMQRVAKALVDQGVDLLLVGCTELSVLAAYAPLAVEERAQTLDAAEVVARHIVALARDTS